MGTTRCQHALATCVITKKERIKILSVRLAPEIMEHLELLAHKTERTKSFHAREAILRYLEEAEDASIAIERLETSTKRWTLAELENE